MNRIFKIVLVCLPIFYICHWIFPRDQRAAPPLIFKKFYGVCYGPFRNGQNPDRGIFPGKMEIMEDLEGIARISSSLRFYGMSGTQKSIPGLCINYGIDCYPGAWISADRVGNEKEIKALIDLGKLRTANVIALVIGNEVLLREDIPKKELIGLIRRVKNETGLPVTTAEIWKTWLQNPDLIDAVDFGLVHIHPYWDGVNIEVAAAYVIRRFNEVRQRFPRASFLIGETGWPSSGETVGTAIPSEENQAAFMRDIRNLADDNEIRTFYFEVFDENWKSNFEGRSGAHWGLFNADGRLKPHLKSLFPVETNNAIRRDPLEALKN